MQTGARSLSLPYRFIAMDLSKNYSRGTLTRHLSNPWQYLDMLNTSLFTYRSCPPSAPPSTLLPLPSVPLTSSCRPHIYPYQRRLALRILSSRGVSMLAYLIYVYACISPPPRHAAHAHRSPPLNLQPHATLPLYPLGLLRACQLAGARLSKGIHLFSPRV